MGESSSKGPVRRISASEVGVAVVVTVGVVARLVVSSPLWLDETLSVNIASHPVSEIPGLLRRDGHPPLYYLLLHGWMKVVGSGDLAVRSLSALWGVALFPLTWVAARRAADRRTAATAVVLVCLSPFAAQYASEARMYAMVSTLALTWWLVARSAWYRGGLKWLAGLAACTSLLLWTHYWALWFLAAAGLGLAVTALRATRAGDLSTRSRAVSQLVAMAVGGLTFVPWLPALWYQRAHTGTPWARPARPAEVISFLAEYLGGWGSGEAKVLGWSLLALLAVGAWVRFPRPWTAVVDLRQPRSVELASMAWLVGATLSVATVVGQLTGTAFAARYASVVAPFIWILAAAALAQMRPRQAGLAALAVLSLLGGLGLVLNATAARTDAGRNAAAIRAAAKPGDLVVYCPDQTGPATARALGPGFDQVTFPDLATPGLVDWVDYLDHNASVTPRQFADRVLQRAGDRTIFLVYSVAIHSHREVCPAVLEELGRQRPSEVLTNASTAYDPAGVVRLPVR